MEKLIKQLDSTFLESWGFHYDGSDWIHKNYPFILKLSNKESTYMVITDSKDGIPSPPPISTSTGLLQLIINYSMYYIDKKLRDKKFISNSAQMEAIKDTLREYLSFDRNLSFQFTPGPMGQLGLMPGNEYTHTIISGLELIFRVHFNDNEFEDISINPECISYLYLQNRFDRPITKVELYNEKLDEWYPFFGCGIPIIPEP